MNGATAPLSGRCSCCCKLCYCFHICGCWYSAPLGVEDEVGEVLLLGFDVEVVVSDAVPLVVEEADEGNDEAERQADSENGDSNHLKSVKFLLEGLCMIKSG